MKKFFMSMMGMVLALGLATSCSEEQVNPAGESDVKVTFTVNMEGEQGSRAYSDGYSAEQLIFAVYEAGAEIDLKDLRQEGVRFSGLKATVTTKLVKGKTYDFVFWAQPVDAKAFDVSDMRHIKVKYDGVSNDELRDAFYHAENGFHVTGAVNLDVTLYRPFAQLNFGTADWAEAVSAGVVESELQTQVAVQGVYTQLNTYYGSVEGETTAVFTLANVPTDPNKSLYCDADKDGKDEEYRWLAMNYVLVPAEKMMSNGVAMDVKSSTVYNNIPVPNVPLQRNYRTNIVGNLLTTGVVFNVEISPIYNEPDYVISVWDGSSADAPEVAENGDIMIKTANELAGFAAAVNAGDTFKGKTVKLAANINLAGHAWTSITGFAGTFDGQGFTISNLNVKGQKKVGLFGAVIARGTIKNVNVENATVEGTYKVAVIAGDAIAATISGCSVKNATVLCTPAKNAQGKYDDGNNAGVIVGYISGETKSVVSGNTVDNSAVTAYRAVGAVAGRANSGTTVEGNTVTNTKVIANRQLDAAYVEYKAVEADKVVGSVKNSTLGENVAGDDVTVTVLKSLADINKDTAEGGNVTLTDNTEGVAESGSSYGKTGFVIDNGAVFDGNGNVLTVNGANGTWDCGIAAKWGTIQNVTINGCFRGIFMPGAGGDVIIDNVVLDDVCYTFNSDAGNKDYEVKISNSTLNGWTSYSNVHKLVTFTNCKFGKGTGGYKHAFCRPYAPSVFENCEFAAGFEFDTTQQANIVFKNCTYNGEKITAENAASLKSGETIFFYKGVGTVTFE